MRGLRVRAITVSLQKRLPARQRFGPLGNAVIYVLFNVRCRDRVKCWLCFRWREHARDRSFNSREIIDGDDRA
jgi:hypothetical protein